jgi:hypothetical protein
MCQLANDIAKVPRTHGGFILGQLKNMLRDWEQGHAMINHDYFAPSLFLKHNNKLDLTSH